MTHTKPAIPKADSFLGVCRPPHVDAHLSEPRFGGAFPSWELRPVSGRRWVMTPWDVLQRLYAAEINAGLQTDWDGGVVAWIGGPMIPDLSALPESGITASRLPRGLSTTFNPVLTCKTFESDAFNEVAAWMDAEARRLFPDAYH